MKTMFIYEPAMCCEMGLCGVGVDPELLRISTVVSNLKKNGVSVERYNLNNFPQEFVKSVEINKLIHTDGVEALPATVVDGTIVKTGKYPTNEEIENWLDVKISSDKENESGGCGCTGGCC